MPSPKTILEAALSGAHGPIQGNIPLSFATALTAMVRRIEPTLCIEIGMAYGISTLAILEGLEDGGRLVSIDPFQSSSFDGFGRKMVELTDRSDRHELVERPDYIALPEMLGSGAKAQFIYIDGMHTFDYVALDAFYAHKLLDVGGVVGFNDCGFRSIHKFLRYFTKHREYEEIDSGLPRDFRGGNPAISIVRKMEGRSSHDRYFRKLTDHEPVPHFFKNF